jgi:hypothetical protein
MPMNALQAASGRRNSIHYSGRHFHLLPPFLIHNLNLLIDKPKSGFSQILVEFTRRLPFSKAPLLPITSVNSVIGRSHSNIVRRSADISDSLGKSAAKKSAEKVMKAEMLCDMVIQGKRLENRGLVRFKNKG